MAYNVICIRYKHNNAFLEGKGIDNHDLEEKSNLEKKEGGRGGLMRRKLIKRMYSVPREPTASQGLSASK